MKQGREYWEGRKKLGRPKKIKTPAKLWELACEYFISADENPVLKQELIKGGELAGMKKNIEIMCPYTWEGLSDYLFEKGIIDNIKDYKSNRDGRYDEFVPIIRTIGQVIYKRNFNGAAAQVLSTNLIARQLGLAEKVISESDVNVTQEVDYSKLSPEALEEIARAVSSVKDDDGADA